MAGKRKSRSSSTKEHKNNDEEADAYLTPSKGMMNGEFDSDSEDEGEMLRIMRQLKAAKAKKRSKKRAKLEKSIEMHNKTRDNILNVLEAQSEIRMQQEQTYATQIQELGANVTSLNNSFTKLHESYFKHAGLHQKALNRAGSRCKALMKEAKLSMDQRTKEEAKFKKSVLKILEATTKGMADFDKSALAFETPN